MRNIFLKVAHSLLIVSGFLGLGLCLVFAEGTQVVTTTTASASTLVTITDNGWRW